MKAEKDKTTLFVRHLPEELSTEDREDLLRLVGAVKVRIMPDNNRMKHTAFATFQTHEEAKHALSLLHQREILGHCLAAEFAMKRQVPETGDPSRPIPKEPSVTEPSRKEVVKVDMEEFSKGLHGVAPTLGLDYLPSPLLKYKYPPPTATVLQNISHALASCPKFYTQVLHLMNKMNLPAPFGPPTPAPPLAMEEVAEETRASEEEEESEYESESEKREDERQVVQKRPPARPKPKRKKRKLPDLVPAVHPASTPREKTEPSEVFESQPLSQKKISMKIDPGALETPHEVAAKEESAGGFGAFGGPTLASMEHSEQQQVANDDWHDGRFVSLEELRRKRISSREMRTMSIFRNYSPGEPTFRLYIKNLAKQAVEKDLRHIFGRFVDVGSEQEREMFDIKLMKEGRMKGQAFITLANEKQAAEALKETNGFVLHTKPLVVHFARSAKPKDGK